MFDPIRSPIHFQLRTRPSLLFPVQFAMPSISSGKVLVTGANGFIAAHCVAKLLLSGFSVIGTVRSEAKAQSVLRSHSNHPSLSLIIVEDVTKPGCFDTAIAGCDGVLHLAAPFGYVYTNFETELLIPSINGTLRICEAAQTEKSVKRVVLTSSFASVYDASKGQDPGKTYTEDNWCPLTYEDGKNASAAPIAYRASKVLAEKTAWNFITSNEVAWDLVTLLEIHNLLMDTFLKENDKIDRKGFEMYFPVVERTLARVREMVQDGNAAVGFLI